MVKTAALDLELARRVVASVADPEIPVLTIEDLGILRGVTADHGQLRVTVTPTYSGCPAMRQIEDDIVSVLARRGFDDVRVERTHQPSWSTDWMTADGRRKLQEYGIAPPGAEGDVVCPRCREGAPRMVARFGSTACKALMVCSSCGEPFDLFKEHR